LNVGNHDPHLVLLKQDQIEVVSAHELRRLRMRRDGKSAYMHRRNGRQQTPLDFRSIIHLRLRWRRIGRAHAL
jgi:hypothetical protein